MMEPSAMFVESDPLPYKDFVRRVQYLWLRHKQMSEFDQQFLARLYQNVVVRLDQRDLGMESLWEPSVKQINYVSSLYEDYT